MTFSGSSLRCSEISSFQCSNDHRFLEIYVRKLSLSAINWVFGTIAHHACHINRPHKQVIQSKMLTVLSLRYRKWPFGLNERNIMIPTSLPHHFGPLLFLFFPSRKCFWNFCDVVSLHYHSPETVCQVCGMFDSVVNFQNVTNSVWKTSATWRPMGNPTCWSEVVLPNSLRRSPAYRKKFRQQ